MRRRVPFRFAVIAAVLLSGCAGGGAASAQDEGPSIEMPDAPMTAAEMDGIRAQIEQNWNLDVNHPCGRPVSLRVRLAVDGTVQKAEPMEDFPEPACRAAADAAIPAIQISSPLKLPPHRQWKTMVLRFDDRL